ncbi:MAG: hypothetical protein ACTHL5_11340 [Rhodanobacter sp.]
MTVHQQDNVVPYQDGLSWPTLSVRAIRAFIGAAGMKYEAIVDSNTLAMRNARTGEPLDAVAVIPDHLPDLAKLVAAMSSDTAVELARMAESRAFRRQ